MDRLRIDNEREHLNAVDKKGKGGLVIHLFFSTVSAAVSLAWERQVKKARDAHRFIIETIHSERDEIEKLRDKYMGLLNKAGDKPDKRRSQ
jgi:hypothetical protein